MRKLSAGLFMSLDGVVESPNQWGFQYMTKEMAQGISTGVSQADAVLIGRRTYLGFAEMWPGQGDDVPMASFLNHSPKYVVSSTLDSLPWQPATLIRGDLFKEIMKLKQQPGKNIQVPGSPRLVRWLLLAGLLDEISLSICPVVVGSGLRLFDEVTRQVRLEVAHATVLSSGVIGVTYRPVREGEQPAEPPINFPDAASKG